MDTATPTTPRISEREGFASPTVINLPGGAKLIFKLDSIKVRNGICAIGGWMSQHFTPGIQCGGQGVPVKAISRFVRPDVNQHLGTPPDYRHGFGLAFSWEPGNDYAIILENTTFPLWVADEEPDYGENSEAILGHEVFQLLQSSKSAEEQWREEIESGCSAIKGGLDCVLRWPDAEIGNPLIIAGWATTPEGCHICLGELNLEEAETLIFFTRPDIDKELDFLPLITPKKHGFICVARNYPVSQKSLPLYIEKNGIKAKISEKPIQDFFSWRPFLRAVFEIDFPYGEIIDIYKKIFLELLGPIQRKRESALKTALVMEGQFGNCPQKPEKSIIIPLFGSLDILDTQFRRFFWDGDFQVVELIYVLADPGLLDQFQIVMPSLTLTAKGHCRWLYAHAPLSFAEACNLGAAKARGKCLFFVNSDIYPVEPGWMRKITEIMDTHPQAGLVGCRLEYPDGTPQHCGAYLTPHPYLPVFHCVHRLERDIPESQPTSYVTGACMAIQREDFQTIKGFDTDYIIGNWEDMDLCRKITALGKEVRYLDNVIMIHDAHHSFKTIEPGKWQDRLGLYNALLFKEKWGK